MELKPYTITYCPFSDSDATSTRTEYAENEQQAMDNFEKRFPLWRIKEVKEA